MVKIWLDLSHSATLVPYQELVLSLFAGREAPTFEHRESGHDDVAGVLTEPATSCRAEGLDEHREGVLDEAAEAREPPRGDHSIDGTVIN